MARHALSELETRILKYLIVNGIPLNSGTVKKKLRLSRETFNYVLKKLEAKKVIRNHKYAVDFRLLGLDTVCWVFIKLNRDSCDAACSDANFLAFPQVHVACSVTGEYDLALKVYARSNSELAAFTRELETGFGHCINSINSMCYSEMNKNHNLAVEGVKQFNLSRADLRILGHRMQNPGDKLGDVAKTLGLHRNTVSKRWHRMVQNRLVVKKSVILDPKYYRKAGIGFVAIMLLKTRAGKSEAAMQALLKIDNIHELGAVPFPAGLLAVVRTASLRKFYEFSQRLLMEKQFNANISDSTSFVVMDRKSHKQDYLKALGLLGS